MQFSQSNDRRNLFTVTPLQRNVVIREWTDSELDGALPLE